MPPKLIGHPDFIQYSSTPIATLTAQLGPFANGQSAIQNVPVPSGGSYILALYPDNFANGFMTDVTVGHVDANGTVILSELYGAIPCGTFSTAVPSFQAPTLLRGNIYGVQLNIGFNSQTAANMNTILGVAGIARANVLCNVYITPGSMTDPDPKVSTSFPLDGSGGPNYPQGMLYTANGIAINFGADTGQVIVAPYSGPCKLTLRQTGVTTTPTNILAGIRSYTVGNGTPALSNLEFNTVAAGVGYEWDIDLPNALSIIKIQNLDGAQNATVIAAIMADKQA